MVPIYFLLIPYGFFLLIFLFLSLVDVFHLFRFGTSSFVAFLSVVIYCAVAAMLIYASYNAILTVDWTRTVQIIPSFGAPTFE